ncbi:uncharacterized protein LOC134272214 [Saccostrea cucullata]|uniref:uncharacterized protein LOC134272214 n=1 Tax=Saccostrea cuccullata TaxID=36930 RepID=UPI002ED4AD1D
MTQCDLCESIEVEVHCDSCLVNLCKACVGVHMISDECTDHKLIKYQSRKPTRLYPESITEHARVWHTEIEKHSLKFQAKVEKMKSTKLQALQKHLDEINKNISDLRNDIKSIERTIDANDMSKLLRVTSNVHLYSNLPQKIAPSLPKSIPGEVQGEEFGKLFGILLPSSLTLNENGYSLKPKRRSSEARSPPQVKQLLDEPEIVTNIDTEFEYLINVACLSDKRKRQYYETF